MRAIDSMDRAIEEFLLKEKEVVEHAESRDNPHAVTKEQVGLGNVDNILQASKAEFDSHTGNTSNPHGVTKTQVGLGSVDNAKQATKTEFDAHTGNNSNPHGVTKEQVELGNVDNIKQATKAEFDTHTEDTEAHGIGESISRAISGKAEASDLTAHTGNNSNPHGVTKAQVGLGSVDNAKQATKTEFDAHTGNNSNPHGVTKEQVELGNVDNIKQATKAEFDTHTEDTEAHGIGESISRAISGKAEASDLTAHTGNNSNPHGVTKAQVGLGSVDNAKQATKTEFDAHTGNNSNPHGVTKEQVELGNVDNIKQATKAEFDTHTEDTEAHGIGESIAGAVSEHNEAADAHTDIRTALANKVTHLDVLTDIAQHNEANDAHEDIRKKLDCIKYYGDADIIPSSQDLFTFSTNSNNSATLTGVAHGAELSGNIVIPYEYKNGNKIYKINRIRRYAFFNQASITSVTIPSSVTYIDYYAFQCCTALSSITIPDSVTYIEISAFDGCSSLTSITIPSGVSSIRESTFSDCSSLTKITIPDGVRSIGEGAFRNCLSLETVKIGNGVTSIGLGAFTYCNSLTSITIPDSVMDINEYAFYPCNSLTDVYYTGTKDQWDTITIGENNTPLQNATKHYNNVLIAKGEVEENIARHNEANDAHSDIRTALDGKATPSDIENAVSVHNEAADAHVDIRSELNGKADKTELENYYDKTETDTMISLSDNDDSKSYLMLWSVENGFPVLKLTERS